MKFNAVVGNPPYQEADGGAGASSIPIYPNFVHIAETLSSNFVSIIIPTRWFTGGKHLDDFRKSMLDDIHIKELHDCLYPEEIFPNTNNRGGICYFLWDINYDNSAPTQVKVVTHNGNDETIEAVRPLRTRDLDIFIRNANAISILNKVIPVGTVKTDTMEYYVSARKPFNIESNIVKTAEWHTDKTGLISSVACYGKRQQLGYVEKRLVTKNVDMIEKWKVFTPRANNVGTELSDDNLNTFIGAPGTICTEAYMVIGAGLNLDENRAKNLMSFFKTKFARFMHSLAKASHDATQVTYRFVPVVDFSQEWTDEKLYTKYGLTQSEIDLIESSIKPMA